jgi:hypothetical protein
VVAAYVFGVFFVLPGAALLAQSMLGGTSPEVVEAEKNQQQLKAVEAEVQEKEMIVE